MLNKKTNCIVVAVSHPDNRIYYGEQELVESVVSWHSSEMYYGYGTNASRLQEDVLYMVIEGMEAKYGYEVISMMDIEKESVVI